MWVNYEKKKIKNKKNFMLKKRESITFFFVFFLIKL